jgi:hypothetical protein
MPECDVLLAQAAVHLARAPKSQEVYQALGQVYEIIDSSGQQPEVLDHVRKASFIRALVQSNPGLEEVVTDTWNGGVRVSAKDRKLRRHPGPGQQAGDGRHRVGVGRGGRHPGDRRAGGAGGARQSGIAPDLSKAVDRGEKLKAKASRTRPDVKLNNLTTGQWKQGVKEDNSDSDNGGDGGDGGLRSGGGDQKTEGGRQDSYSSGRQGEHGA